MFFSFAGRGVPVLDEFYRYLQNYTKKIIIFRQKAYILLATRGSAIIKKKKEVFAGMHLQFIG